MSERSAVATTTGLLQVPPREIAIVMLSALGDAVHVLPVANALKRAYPAARLTWIVQPAAYRLARNHPAVDSFVLFHPRRGLGAWRSFRDVARALRPRRFDLLLDLQVYLKAGLITALASASVKLGFDRARARDLNWLFTTHRIPAHAAGHVQDQYFEFLEVLGVDPHPVEWGLALAPDEREQQRAFLEGLGAPVCAVVVGTSRPQKNWSPERYARLLEVLESDYGFRCVLVGGPGRAEKEAANRVVSLTRAHPVDALGDDVRRLLWILAGSALVISPDTGPLHMARALDVPVVGLFGYTNPRRHGPYRKYEELVVDGYARYPGEAYPISMERRGRGMERVTLEAVLEKVDLAVRRYVGAVAHGGDA
jgi:heptosyltransferase I